MGDQINNPAEQNFASVEVVGLQGLQPVQMTPAELAIVEAFEFLTAEDLRGREIRVLAGVHPDHIVHSVDQKLWGLIIQALVPDSVESAPKVRRVYAREIGPTILLKTPERCVFAVRDRRFARYGGEPTPVLVSVSGRLQIPGENEGESEDDRLWGIANRYAYKSVEAGEHRQHSSAETWDHAQAFAILSCVVPTQDPIQNSHESEVA